MYLVLFSLNYITLHSMSKAFFLCCNPYLHFHSQRTFDLIFFSKVTFRNTLHMTLNFAQCRLILEKMPFTAAAATSYTERAGLRISDWWMWPILVYSIRFFNFLRPFFWLLGFPTFGLLGFCVLGFLSVWDSVLSGFWTSGLWKWTSLSFWVLEILGLWVYEPLGFWAIWPIESNFMKQILKWLCI